MNKERQALAETRKTLECKFNTYASDIKVYKRGEEPRWEKKYCFQTAVNRTKKLNKGKMANES
jgi:hypothetical protein